MKNNWFKVCNAVSTADEAEVLIYDEIGMFGITAKDFVDEVKATGAKQFHVRINSPGGSVFDGISIYNYLRSLKCRVTVDGMAGSIASVIAMAGKTVCMAESSMMMIHNPWGIVIGESADARKLAENLDKIRDQIVKAYVRRSGQEEDQVVAWMDEETWMDAEQAVERGFADEVDAGVEAQNFAMFNLGKFKHPPKLMHFIQDEVDTPTDADMNYDFLRKLCAKLSIAFPEKDADVNPEALAKIEPAISAAMDKSALTTEVTNLKTQVTAKDTEITALKASLKTSLDARLADKAASDAALTAEKNSVQAKVIEELAKLGQKPLAAGGKAEDRNELQEYQSEKDPLLKAQLWEKNKAAIIAQGKAADSKGK